MDLTIPSTSTVENFPACDATLLSSEGHSNLSPPTVEPSPALYSDLDTTLKPLDDMGIPNTWSEDDVFPVPQSVLEYLPALPMPAPPTFDEVDILVSQPETAHYPSPTHSTMFPSDTIPEKDVKDPKAFPGVCGLKNLGNTCFMNAGLQCLMNNRRFARFFLENYESDTNTKDTLAARFSQLASKVWSGQYSAIMPSEFKESLGRCHPQFKDFRQHDCQEFLVLLLDTIHEQLNASRSKSTELEHSVGICLQSVPFPDDKMPEADPEENKSENLDEEDQECTEARDMDLGLALQQEQLPYLQQLSDNSSHSASPRSTDSFNSWDMNPSFRLHPVPDDVKPFKDVASCKVGSPEATGTFCEAGQRLPKESCAVSGSDYENDDGNIVVIENLTRAKALGKTLKQSLLNVTKELKECKPEKNELASKLNLSRKLPIFEDLVKDTKTLNTNVLIAEETNNCFRFDSEKFPKLDHTRPRETVDNLAEMMDLEPKTNSLKRVKKTNLLKGQKEMQKNVLDASGMADSGALMKRMKMGEASPSTSRTVGIVATPNNMDVDLQHANNCREPDGLKKLGLPCKRKVPVQALEELEANRQWEKYLAKNQSVVVDTFQGQFKSTVVCLECSHVSVTYEPFMYLPVPLPHALERQIAITYLPSGNRQPVRYLVTIHKHEKVKKIKEALQELVGGDPAPEIAIAEVFDNHISRILDDSVMVCYINDTNRTVHAFELEPIRGSEYHPELAESASTVESSMGNCMGDGLASGSGSQSKDHPLPVQGSSTAMAGRSVSSKFEVADISSPGAVHPITAGNGGDCSSIRGSAVTSDTTVLSGSALGVPSFAPAVEANDDVTLGTQDNTVRPSQWQSCAICLEEMAVSELLIHPPCQCVLCQNCIEVSCKHYGGSSLICPVCSIPVKPEEEFVPVSRLSDYKHKIRLVCIPLVFRVDTFDQGFVKNKNLIGPPALLRVPSRLHATALYESVDKCVPFLSTYSLLFVDGQGRNCSRCMYSQRCHGCEVARVGDIILQPGDNLAVRFTELFPENLVNAVVVVDHKSMQDRRKQEILTLYDCLQAFSKSEVLDEQNPWFCPVCRLNRRARKTLSVLRSPDTLMVYLKRFVFHDSASTKVDDSVIFPMEDLDLSQFVSGPCTGSLVYNLQACVCHFGGASSGHYTAYARHATSGEWYYFNDDTASKQSPREEDHSNAYILFYQRPGSKADSLIRKKDGTTYDKPEVSPDDGSCSSVGLRPDTFRHILQQLEDSSESEKENREKEK